MLRGNNDDLLKNFAYAGTFGSIGGFFSVSYKMKDFEIDIDESEKIYYVNALIRICISIFAGIVIFSAIKAKLILGNLIDDSNMFILYTICVAAGFSEQLIPNIFKKIERDSGITITNRESDTIKDVKLNSVQS
jgi:hypothetical protein